MIVAGAKIDTIVNRDSKGSLEFVSESIRTNPSSKTKQPRLMRSSNAIVPNMREWAVRIALFFNTKMPRHAPSMLFCSRHLVDA